MIFFEVIFLAIAYLSTNAYVSGIATMYLWVAIIFGNLFTLGAVGLYYFRDSPLVDKTDDYVLLFHGYHDDNLSRVVRALGMLLLSMLGYHLAIFALATMLFQHYAFSKAEPYFRKEE